MDGAGDQFLPGSRFTPDQHGRVAFRNLLDHVEDALQSFAGADDSVELVDILLSVPEVVELVLKALNLERFLNLDLHLLDFERLLHVVEGPGLHGFDGGGDRSERSHQNYGGGGMERTRRAKYVESVAAAHLQVAQNDVKVAVVQPLDSRVAVGGFVDFVSSFRESAGESTAKRVVVVSYQNAAHTPSILNLAPFT